MNTSSETQTNASPGRRVVVVDDNAITLRLMSTWLEQAGYQVCPATDGPTALKIIDSANPSIVVTDWNMPEMSGVDLCRVVRGREEQPYVYMLIVTAREDRRDVVEAIDAGADDFVAKPVKQEELVARVTQAEAVLGRFEHFVDMAERDALTGLMNRRKFHELSVREIARASQHGVPFSCALLDIDMFKSINDTYGHSAGDAALKAIAEMLKQQTRDCDFICRYGGDEFCLLLPRMRERDATEFADRLRNAVENLEVSDRGRQIEIKATIGVAEWRQDLLTPRQLIDQADEALLAAKRSGRNCVVGFGAFNDLHFLDEADNYERQFADAAAEQIMTTPVVTLAEDQPLREAADLFLRLRINSVPIVDKQSKLVGIISETDVLNAVSTAVHWDRPVAEVMKKDVVSYEASTSAAAIWEFLRRVTLRRVVVVDDGVPVGVVSRGTLLRWLGNWGAFRGTSCSLGNPSQAHTLCEHVRTAASAIVRETERIQAEVQRHADGEYSAASLATRLQEQAQDLLALCQLQYSFDPRPTTTPSATKLARYDRAAAAPCLQAHPIAG